MRKAAVCYKTANAVEGHGPGHGVYTHVRTEGASSHTSNVMGWGHQPPNSTPSVTCSRSTLTGAFVATVIHDVTGPGGILGLWTPPPQTSSALSVTFTCPL